MNQSKAELVRRKQALQTALNEMKSQGLPLRSLVELCDRAGVSIRCLNNADTIFYRDIREEAIAYRTKQTVNGAKISEAIDSLLSPGPMPRKINFALVRRMAGINPGISKGDYPEFAERVEPLLEDDDDKVIRIVPAVLKRMTWEDYAGDRPLCG